MARLRLRGSVLALFAVLAVTVTADSGANHQDRSDQFGTSGGNVNDITRAFCCSGTLGAVVSDGSRRFVLSNNHVLARTNQAAPGEDVSQPGLIDNGCRAGDIVADLTAYPLLGSSNVDAAIAELRSGQMDASGYIMDIGVPSSTTAPPSVGLAVAKSGRTTGLTTGSIGAVNASVAVQYQERCNAGRRFRVNYTNQIVVNGSTFSAGGDSGSLIVTNDGAHHPVGLLYAGSSSTTIANPIDEVLSRVGVALGRTVSFNLGGGRGGRAREQTSSLGVDEIARGTRAKENHASRLMQDPSVVAVGVGEDPDLPGQAAVIVYLQRGQGRSAVARELDGVRVHVVETDPIVAYGWNQPVGQGCQTTR